MLRLLLSRPERLELLDRYAEITVPALVKLVDRLDADPRAGRADVHELVAVERDVHREPLGGEKFAYPRSHDIRRVEQ